MNLFNPHRDQIEFMLSGPRVLWGGLGGKVNRMCEKSYINEASNTDCQSAYSPEIEKANSLELEAKLLRRYDELKNKYGSELIELMELHHNYAKMKGRLY